MVSNKAFQKSNSIAPTAMAVFSHFCLMIIFLISVTLLVKTGFSSEFHDDQSNVPTTEINSVPSLIIKKTSTPNPLSPYEKYCKAKLPSGCFYQFFFGLDSDNLKSINKDCCFNLVRDMGKPCYDAITRYILKLPEFNSRKTRTLQLSNEIWSQCNRIILPDKSPVTKGNNTQKRPPTSYEKYLENCTRRLNSENCSDQILNATFYGQEKISKDCCRNLVQGMGKPCHQSVTNYIRETLNFKQNKTQILQRANQIWNDCT